MTARAVRAVKSPKKPRRARRALRVGLTCYPTFGGSGIIATELGRRLAVRGDEVHFISMALPYRLPTYERNIFFHEVVVEPYPLFQQYPPLPLALATKMSEVADAHRLDVLHVHYAMPFAASAFLAKQLVAPRALPVVTTLHGTDITVVGQQPAYFRMTKFSIESSDRVTAVSHALREATVETLGIRKPIDVIYNFVDPEVFAPRRKRMPLLAPAGAVVLMHASNFRPVKNVDQVVRIFAAVHDRRDARLVMVGDGPEKPRAEELARQLGVGKHVLFLGNQEVMEELLPLADVFLLPSSTESFGLVALEAMSAGVPVVASRVGGLPELVEHGKSGLLEEAGDVEAHVRAVIKILEDPKLAHRMGAAGRKRAIEHFHVDRIVDRYRRVYEELL
ncbi:MAG: N-acetyl-alpha-D-glucosaminyl L-malate synthase BshA [Candidatus Eiseniibacteriota bacterium]